MHYDYKKLFLNSTSKITFSVENFIVENFPQFVANFIYFVANYILFVTKSVGEHGSYGF